MKSHPNRSRALALFLGFLLSVFLGEVAVRLMTGRGFQLVNYLRAPFQLKKGVVIGLHDPLLGWKNSQSMVFIAKNLIKRRYKVDPNLVFSKVSYDERGFRRNLSTGREKKGSQRPILALGDSFTFGGEVSDEETWPSHLENLTDYTVLNAGVSVYGFDQELLSLETFLKNGMRPRIVIFSLTPSNIERVVRTHRISQPSGASVPKPFFRAKNGYLVLEGVPIPESQSETDASLGLFRNIFGFSAFADLFFKKVAFRFWMGAPDRKNFPAKYKTGESSVQISCLLLQRIKEVSEKFSFTPIIFGQEHYQSPERDYQLDDSVEQVLSCSKKLGLPTVETASLMKSIFEEDYEDYLTLFIHGGHMSNRGNLLMAKTVMKSIEKFL